MVTAASKNGLECPQLLCLMASRPGSRRGDHMQQGECNHRSGFASAGADVDK
jgi:hypothetical protein